MNRFNEWLAVKLTQGVGSMTCAYLFFLWALMPIPVPQMANVVSYVSQSVIQLVLLSVIMVGQDIGNRAHEKRDNETHDAVMEELERQRNLNKVMIEELAEVKQLHRESTLHHKQLIDAVELLAHPEKRRLL